MLQLCLHLTRQKPLHQRVHQSHEPSLSYGHLLTTRTLAIVALPEPLSSGSSEPCSEWTHTGGTLTHINTVRWYNLQHNYLCFMFCLCHGFKVLIPLLFINKATAPSSVKKVKVTVFAPQLYLQLTQGKQSCRIEESHWSFIFIIGNIKNWSYVTIYFILPQTSVNGSSSNFEQTPKPAFVRQSSRTISFRVNTSNTHTFNACTHSPCSMPALTSAYLTVKTLDLIKHQLLDYQFR